MMIYHRTKSSESSADDDINYKYYIDEAKKIINLIEKPQGIQISLFT